MADLSALEQQYGLPAGLLSSVEQTESGGNPNAVSSKGALGAFQFMPDTAKQYGIDPKDPDQAAQGAARMYADLLDKYDGDVPSALAAYNWGQGNVDKKGLANAPEETRNYIGKVMAGLSPQQASPVSSALSAVGNFIMPSAQAEEMPKDFSKSALGQVFGGNSEPDLSHMSDAQLEQLSKGQAPALATTSEPDLSHLSDEQLQQLASGNQKNFWQREGEDISKRSSNATAAANAYLTGQQGLPGGQGLPQTAIQMVGNLGYGPANDLIKNAAISGYRALPDSVQNYIGDKATDAKDYIVNSPVGQAVAPYVKDIAGGVSQIAQDNPNAARTLGAVNDIASFAPLMEGAGKAADVVGGGLEKVGGAVENAGLNQAQASKDKFVQDLVLPKETPSVLEDQVPRTTEKGILGTKVYDPTPEEKAVADVVGQIPEVKAGNTIQKNFTAVQSALGTEATTLKKNLEDNDVYFPRKEVNSQLNQVVTSLQANPLLTGDAAETAQKIVDQMRKFILNNKASASGLLQARKDLDKWIKTQKGGVAFDPVKENAVSTALREVRQTVNGFINQKVPVAGVADSLRKQNLMYKAMDNMAPKAAAEAKTSIGRVGQRIANAIPVKGDIGKAATALAALGIGGGVTAVAPAVVLGGATAYGIGKAIGSATTKNIIGKTITGVGKASKAITPR